MRYHSSSPKLTSHFLRRLTPVDIHLESEHCWNGKKETHLRLALRKWLLSHQAMRQSETISMTPSERLRTSIYQHKRWFLPQLWSREMWVLPDPENSTAQHGANIRG